MSRTQRYPLALWMFAVVLAIALAPVAEARRFRAVRPSNPQPSLGPCHTFGFVTPGLKATYRTSSTGQPDVTYAITYVKDTLTESKVTQQVSVPGIGSADAQTTILFDTVGDLRAVRHMDIDASIKNIPVIGTVSFNTDIDFFPSMTWGPGTQWCENASWSIPATTIQTVTTINPAGFGTPTNSTTSTLAGVGQVLSVNESITVPAGTFNTVKYRGVSFTNNCVPGATNCVAGVSPVMVWIWKDQPITIRQDTLDGSGNVTSTTVLTAKSPNSSTFIATDRKAKQ